MLAGRVVCLPSANPLSLQRPKTLLHSSNPRNSKLINLRVTATTKTSTSNFPLASKIIVRNLSYSTSDTSLKKEFSNFGEVVEVKLVKDESGKRSKGYAFIQYTSQDDAMLALETMDRKYIDGRTVYVEIAKPVTNTFGAFPRTSGPPTEEKNIEANGTEGLNL